MAVILAAGGVALASASPTQSSSGDQSGREIKLFAKTVQNEDIDLGTKGISLGDQFVFSDDLSREKGSEKIGFDGGVCTLVRLDQKTSATAQCEVTLWLKGGQIAGQGLVTFSDEATPTFVVPITGGSGAYKAARGEVKVKELSDTDSILTVSLLDSSGH
jgi:hypothetical protein